MILVLNGNICSGKTTVGQILSTKLGWQIFCIDDYRRQFNPENTRDGDYNAVSMLISDISFYESDCIVEVTSTNKRFEDIISAHRGQHFIVNLHCSVPELLRRYTDRTESGYVSAPFPYYKSEGIHTAMHAIQDLIENYPANVEISSEDVSPKVIADFIISALKREM